MYNYSFKNSIVIYSLLIIMLSTFSVFAQNTNSKYKSLSTTELGVVFRKAIAEKQYAIAGATQKELKTRNAFNEYTKSEDAELESMIKDAVDNKNFKLAGTIQKELKSRKKPTKIVEKKASNPAPKQEIKPVPTKTEVKKVKPNYKSYDVAKLMDIIRDAAEMQENTIITEVKQILISKNIDVEYLVKTKKELDELLKKAVDSHNFKKAGKVQKEMAARIGKSTPMKNTNVTVHKETKPIKSKEINFSEFEQTKKVANKPETDRLIRERQEAINNKDYNKAWELQNELDKYNVKNHEYADNVNISYASSNANNSYNASSNNSSTNEQENTFTGVISYKLTYSGTLMTDIVTKSLANKSFTTIKGHMTKITSETLKYKTTSIIDNRNKTVLSYYDDGNKTKTVTKKDINDINKALELVHYQIYETNETKNILGYLCNKVTIINDAGFESYAYYTKEIGGSNPNWYSSLNKIEGLILEQNTAAEGIEILYKATNISKENVSSSAFNELSGYSTKQGTSITNVLQDFTDK